jgi:haloacetate dehalogenase
MSDDLFPGFTAHWIDTAGGRLFARAGGPEGAPPVLMLHGFPQTHACWHRIAPALAATHRVVCLDLKGYGWSAAPKGDARHEAYSKRVLAQESVEAMERLGHVRFAVVGHDRGARVGYRMALDTPGRVERLALLDIYPTHLQWQRIEAGTIPARHWASQAEPAPIPETEIGRDPLPYFDGLLANWTKAKSLDAFDRRALAAYRAGVNEPSRIHAFCEDYRAGATRDREQDVEDLAAGKRIDCPVLVLTGTSYLTSGGEETALAGWRRTFAPGAVGEEVDSGHFLAEENAPATLAALQRFLG